MPRGKQIKTQQQVVRNRRLDNGKLFILTNGKQEKESTFTLTWEEASPSSVFSQRIKSQKDVKQQNIEFELEGMSNQNIQDLGTFLLTSYHQPQKAASVSAPIQLKFPVRSQDANETITSPDWAGSYANHLLSKNNIQGILQLLYCASGLHLPVLEQVCLVCVAILLKGKSMLQMQQLFHTIVSP